MTRIVITQNMNLFPDQIKRLEDLGTVSFFDSVATSGEEWLERVKDADIICGDFGDTREYYLNTHDVFYSLPFVNVGWADKEKLAKQNIKIANAPGCNKEAVAEWIVAMTLNLTRRIPHFMKIHDLPEERVPKMTIGLTGKRVTVLGAGNVGKRAGDALESLGAKVKYFKRGDDLIGTIQEAEVIINCLGSNESTNNLLDKKFFSNLQKDSYFITITSFDVYDREAMLRAIEEGILAGVADDCAGIAVGDTEDEYYKKLCSNHKVIATPHVAFNTDVTARKANDIMIDNIEAWIEGKPINLVG